MGSFSHSLIISSNHFPFSLLLTLLLAATATATFPSHSASATTGLTERWIGEAAAVADRKSTLIGPGSSPPACRSRCGRCWPCEPVHVPIQPGLILPLEYYPEAWRCRCGNRLFNP